MNMEKATHLLYFLITLTVLFFSDCFAFFVLSCLHQLKIGDPLSAVNTHSNWWIKSLKYSERLSQSTMALASFLALYWPSKPIKPCRALLQFTLMNNFPTSVCECVEEALYCSSVNNWICL